MIRLRGEVPSETSKFFFDAPLASVRKPDTRIPPEGRDHETREGLAIAIKFFPRVPISKDSGDWAGVVGSGEAPLFWGSML